MAGKKKMGPGKSGDNKQAALLPFTMDEIEHTMFLTVVHGTSQTANFPKLSGLFFCMPACKIPPKVRSYLSCSSLRHFQYLSVDPFRIAVYYFIKVLLARKLNKQDKVS